MNAIRVLSIAIAMLLAAAMRSSAQDTPMSPDPDGGGAAFTIVCGRDQVLRGITIKPALAIVGVMGICRSITNDGVLVGQDSLTRLEGGGGTGGQTSNCGNQAAAGIGAWYTVAVQTVQIWCKAIGSAGAVSGTASPQPVVGVGTGAAWGPFNCTQNNPAVGVIGMATSGVVSVIQRIGLKCGRPVPFGLRDLLLPFSITAGNSAQGRVRATRQALIALNVAITTSSDAIVVPDNSASIGEGASEKTFTVRGIAGGCATITGSNRGITRSDQLVVHPAIDPMARLSFSFQDQILLVGQNRDATLTAAAGSEISVRSSNTNVATVSPATITVGSSGSATFQIRGAGDGCTLINATLNGRSFRKTVKVMTLPG
ncbi:MAG TPA: hypothetical protein VIF83_12480 [Gemmatimonadaceae bacterium]